MLQMGRFRRAQRRHEGRWLEVLQTRLKRKQQITQPGPDAYSKTMERLIRRACLNHHCARAVQVNPLRIQRLVTRALCGWLGEALGTRRRQVAAT